MTERELIDFCSLGESTTVQYKLDFTTQKQIAEELMAFANTRGGIIVFGAETNIGKIVVLTYKQVQYTSRELGNTVNEHVRPVIYIETETVKQVKDEVTTQKANEELFSTIPKSEITTQKPLNAIHKKIFAYPKTYPKATRKETADAFGDNTEDGVKLNMGLLQQYGRQKRKGGRKNGEWGFVDVSC